MPRFTRFGGPALLLLALSVTAGAEVKDCTEISNVPYAVTAPGIYCLKGSLSFTADEPAAIDVQADDVVLEFNGHTLDGGGAKAWGVYAADRSHVTVRNRTIRGFYGGVYLGGVNARGDLAEKLRLDGNSTYGLSVQGQGNVIRKNLVLRTGSSTSSSVIYAIFVTGAGVHVTANEVVETVEAPGGRAFGIFASAGPNAVIEGNVITNGALGPGDSYGILVFGTGNAATLVGNRIVNMRKGIHVAVGSTAIYMDNTVGGATTPFTGGTAAGTTNFTF